MRLASVLTLAVAVPAGLALTAASSAYVIPPRVHAMDAAFGPTVPCGGCDSCMLDDYTYGHFTWDTSAGRDKLGPNGSHPDRCDINSCQEDHPPQSAEDCGEGLAAAPAVAEFWAVVRAGTPDDLSAFVQANGAFVRLDVAKGSAALVGCNGNVVALAPLSRAARKSLS